MDTRPRTFRKVNGTLVLKLVLTPLVVISLVAFMHPPPQSIAVVTAGAVILMFLDLRIHREKVLRDTSKERGVESRGSGEPNPLGHSPDDPHTADDPHSADEPHSPDDPVSDDRGTAEDHGSRAGAEMHDNLEGLTEALMERLSDADAREAEEARSDLYRLRNFNNQLIRLGEITEELNTTLPYRETMARVLQLTRKLLSADIVAMVSPSTTELDLEGVEGCEPGEIELKCCSYYSRCLVRASLRSGELTATKDHTCSLFPHTMRSQLSLPFSLEEGKSLSLIAAAAPKDAFADLSPLIMRSLVAHVRASMSAAEKYDRIRREVVTDPLTNLYNRRFFEKRAGEEIAHSLRYQNPVSLLMLDIDHFKAINDLYGHQTGDKVLQTIARYLKDSVRGSDIVGRYGGEEFVLVLPSTPGPNAMFLADRLRTGLADLMFTGLGIDQHASVTMSGGLATCPRDATTLEDLVAQADKALYRAKEQGRNRIIRSATRGNARERTRAEIREG